MEIAARGAARPARTTEETIEIAFERADALIEAEELLRRET